MHTYLVIIAAQYDICITPLDNVQKWINLTTDKPPTYLFYPHDFERAAKYHVTSTTMSLALATKLKNGVTFGIDYTSVALNIHPHAIEGYEMLYNIIPCPSITHAE